jgi:hypothetical protein
VLSQGEFFALVKLVIGEPFDPVGVRNSKLGRMDDDRLSEGSEDKKVGKANRNSLILTSIAPDKREVRE